MGTWSFLEVVDLIHDLEYLVIDGLKMWWKGFDVNNETLRDLSNDQDSMDLARYALSHKCEIYIYVVFRESDYEEVTEDEVRGELTEGEELFNDQQILVFDHGVDDLFDWDSVMAFDDNDEPSRKQNELRVKSKVSNKGKQKDSGYEDPFVENPSQSDEDPNWMDDNSMTNPPHEEPNTNFKEMHDLETGNETEELYSDVESKDDTTKPGKRFPMFRGKKLSKAFKWTLGMQFTCLQDFKEGMMEYFVLNGYQVCFPKNDHSRVKPVCKIKECPFTTYVSRVGETITFQLKTLELTHTCARVFYNKNVKSKWVTKVLLDKFRTPERFKFPQIMQEMKSTYVVGITRSCAIFARKLTLCQIEGDAIKQYTLLRRYNSEDGKYREALGKWEATLVLAPDVPVVHEQKAQVLLEIGDAWNALKAATRATELDPSWAEAWVTLGRAQLNFGEPNNAIESFDRALALKPDYEEAQDDRKIALRLVKKRKQLHSSGMCASQNRYGVGEKDESS
ncbi:hypothetical protein JHK85_040773 [Glycine max]|nr:hypothetical protein JHK86_040189 [Glycine max]KAG4965798.1 hypothetical protein JHK85_040773 [Glycine max]